MGYGGGYNDGGARQLEMERQARENQGKEAIANNFSQFDDAFYQRRANDYTKFALPQFSDQFQKSRNSLAASLARRGLLGGTADIQANSDLNKYAAGKQREIADAAQGEANKLRAQVESQRGEVTSQLLATSDPIAAGNAALSSAASLKRPSGFSSLGNLFSDWVDNWKANQTARASDPSTPALFSFGRSNRGNVSIVN